MRVLGAGLQLVKRLSMGCSSHLCTFSPTSCQGILSHMLYRFIGTVTEHLRPTLCRVTGHCVLSACLSSRSTTSWRHRTPQKHFSSRMMTVCRTVRAPFPARRLERRHCVTIRKKARLCAAASPRQFRTRYAYESPARKRFLLHSLRSSPSECSGALW